MKASVIAAVAWLLLGSQGFRPAPGGTVPGDIAIVVNPANPISNVAIEDVRHLYEGTRTVFPNGEPVLLLESPEVRERFYEVALDMTGKEATRYWIGLVFSGYPAIPPQAVQDVRELRRLVVRHPGAVAFLDARKVDATVKVLKIHGTGPGDPDYPFF